MYYKKKNKTDEWKALVLAKLKASVADVSIDEPAADEPVEAPAEEASSSQDTPVA